MDTATTLRDHCSDIPAIKMSQDDENDGKLSFETTSRDSYKWTAGAGERFMMIHPRDQIDMSTDPMDARTTSRESYRERTGDTLPIYHPSDHFGGDSDPLDLNTVNRYSAAVSSA
ncbi:hypothetical protein COOONC_21399 [Cooperia oncophora]